MPEKKTVRSLPPMLRRTEAPESQEAEAPKYVRQNVYLEPRHLEAYEQARAKYRRETGKRLEISKWVRDAIDAANQGTE